jgi:ornithine cyclodeaminase
LRAGAIEDVAELGELAAGLRPGRQREEEISICDLTGVGVQDTAIARLCVARVEALGLGTVFAD